ncbi:MAG: hypothetical protein HC902_03285 [Calothrix sp. SM1_5_4]|nr:hypothetical protein [Calothrix sp. SM1_5_4]
MATLDFAFILRKYGKPSKTAPCSEDSLQPYRGHLPSSLLDFWLEIGLGSFIRGRFQYCLPEGYRALVAAVCGEDSQFDAARSHLIGYTAFGELFIWHEIHRFLYVNLPRLTATADLSNPSTLSAERSVATAFYQIGEGATEFRDDSDLNTPLFPSALAELGELELGECYAFSRPLGQRRTCSDGKHTPDRRERTLQRTGRPRSRDTSGPLRRPTDTDQDPGLKALASSRIIL